MKLDFCFPGGLHGDVDKRSDGESRIYILEGCMSCADPHTGFWE